MSKYSKYLDITKNEVHVKHKAIVRLLTAEYKIEDNDMLDEEELELIAGETSSFSIPGTFEIEFPELGESINLFLPYVVNLSKPEEFTSTSKEMVFWYDAGDLLFNCFVKKVETNIDILGSLFENRVKYLRGHVEEQLESIWSQLSSNSNYKSQHLTLILSLLYAKQESGEPLLIRHTKDQDYKKEYAINTKESSHLFSLGAQSFNYGYTNDALVSSVFKNRYNQMSKLNEVYPEELESIQTVDLNKRQKEVNKQALVYTIDKDFSKIKSQMVNQYSDLENIIAGRYDELNDKKNTM